MAKLTFRNSHGQLVDISTVAATKVKNEFGAILEQTMHSGAVAITRHDMPKAVLLSFAEFESLVKERSRSLDDLNAEFDGLLAHMQTSQARREWRPPSMPLPPNWGAPRSRPPKRLAHRRAHERGALPPPRGDEHLPAATYSCVGRRQWGGEEQHRWGDCPSLRRRVFQSRRSGPRHQRERSCPDTSSRQQRSVASGCEPVESSDRSAPRVYVRGHPRREHHHKSPHESCRTRH